MDQGDGRHGNAAEEAVSGSARPPEPTEAEPSPQDDDAAEYLYRLHQPARRVEWRLLNADERDPWRHQVQMVRSLGAGEAQAVEPVSEDLSEAASLLVEAANGGTWKHADDIRALAHRLRQASFGGSARPGAADPLPDPTDAHARVTQAGERLRKYSSLADVMAFEDAVREEERASATVRAALSGGAAEPTGGKMKHDPSIHKGAMAGGRCTNCLPAAPAATEPSDIRPAFVRRKRDVFAAGRLADLRICKADSEDMADRIVAALNRDDRATELRLRATGAVAPTEPAAGVASWENAATEFAWAQGYNAALDGMRCDRCRKFYPVLGCPTCSPGSAGAATEAALRHWIEQRMARALRPDEMQELAALPGVTADPDWRKIAVHTVLPLEVLIASEKSDGEIRDIGPSLRAMIHAAVSGVRAAVSDGTAEPPA